jgi:hypothetical protein
MLLLEMLLLELLLLLLLLIVLRGGSGGSGSTKACHGLEENIALRGHRGELFAQCGGFTRKPLDVAEQRDRAPLVRRVLIGVGAAAAARTTTTAVRDGCPVRLHHRCRLLRLRR